MPTKQIQTTTINNTDMDAVVEGITLAPGPLLHILSQDHSYEAQAAAGATGQIDVSAKNSGTVPARLDQTEPSVQSQTVEPGQSVTMVPGLSVRFTINPA